MNMMLGLARVFSPYQLNPSSSIPLRDVVRAVRIRAHPPRVPAQVFIAATAVRTGKVRLFRTAETRRSSRAGLGLPARCITRWRSTASTTGTAVFTANPAIYPLL